MNVECLTAGEIGAQLGLEVRGNPDIRLSGVAHLQKAGTNDLSFLYQSSYIPYLESTGAGAVIVKSDQANQCPVTCLIADDPYLAYARAAQLLFPRKRGAGLRAPTAVIGDGCGIADTADVGANVVIGCNVEIGHEAIIGPGCVIEDNCSIGAGTYLKARVSLGEGTVLGEECLVHPGAVIGSDGFGFANNRGRWEKIPQVGRVIIGSFVDVGANTTIDRGTVGNTVIRDGVKLDNQIHIAHNVEVGEHTIMAGGVKIAGSTSIGRYCLLGGNVGIVGHLTVADKVTVTACSLVTKSIDSPGSYSSGLPSESSSKWRRMVSRFKHLDDLGRRLKEIEKQLEGV